MINKKIEHPLRTISFDCDETKTALPFEKELLEAYIKLHDDLYAVDRKGSKMIYDYKEVEQELAIVEKVFAPLEVKINGFLEQLRLAKTNKDVSLLENEDFINGVNIYDQEINYFHENLYTVLSGKMDAIEEDYQVFDTDYDAVHEKHDAYEAGPRNELMEKYNDCSMDLCTYDDDEQEFLGGLDNLWEYKTYKYDFIDKYNVVADHINAVYAEGMKLQVLINEIRDDEGLLDNSISESFENGTGDASKKPIYFMESSDETVKGFIKKYGAIAASEVKTVVISVDMDVVEEGNNVMICELLAGLQHYPKLIEKMVLAIKIEIIDHDGLVLPDDQWKGFPPPMHWYNKLSAMPFALFFFEDNDARGFILMGDLLADNRFEVDGDRVKIEGELLQEVTNRLFNTCYFFMVFCHNTGFEPRPYIEGILADFDFPITYEQVKDKFEEDLALGIHLRMVRTNGREPIE